MKFISLVVLEQLNIPNPLGPRARALANPAAAALRASSHDAGRKRPPSLTNGCVRRSSSTRTQYCRPHPAAPKRCLFSPPTAGRLCRPAHPRTSCPSKDDPVGRHELELAPSPYNLPSAFMHQSMVEVADQDKVWQISRTATRPSNDVMGRRPVDLAVTPRPATAPVSRPQRPHRRR